MRCPTSSTMSSREVRYTGSAPTNASGDSVHHQWNSAPPSPQSRRFHSRSRDVTWPFSSVECSRRSGTCQHTFGFQSSGRSPASSGGDVQRAPGAAGEAGSVEEDAGVVDQAGDRDLGAVVGRLAGTEEPPAPGLGVELHLVGPEAHEPGDDVGDVLLVDEVGPVAAAPELELRGRLVEDPEAPLAVDAPVVGAQERGVEHPGALLVGVLEADPLMNVLAPSNHGGRSGTAGVDASGTWPTYRSGRNPRR